MPERATISNISPLLYLHLVGRLDLLLQLYGQVLVPPAVQAELEAGAQQGINVPRVEALSWLRVTPLVSQSLIPLVTDLGRGEAEVIGLALEGPIAAYSLMTFWLAVLHISISCSLLGQWE